MSPAAAIAVDAPAAVARKATYALEELTRITALGLGRRVPVNGSPGIGGGVAALRRGGRPAPQAGEDGFLDFGDGVCDLAMSTFWHLSRWEERAGSARDERGAFPGVGGPLRPRGRRGRPAGGSLPRDRRRPSPASLTVALTHDIDTPWRWSGVRAVAGAAARTKAAVVGRRRPGSWPASSAASPASPATAPAARPELVLRAHLPRSSVPTAGDPRTSSWRGTTIPPTAPLPPSTSAFGPAIVTQVMAQGDELGLHPSYTASERRRR